MAVGHRAHDVAGGEVVEVVVHTQYQGQHHGGQQGAPLGLNVLLGPVAISLGAAGAVHQHHDHTQHDQEREKGHVAAHGFHQRIKGTCNAHDGIKIGVQETAHQAAQEQGRIDFLGDEGQRNGQHRRQKRKRRGEEITDVFGLALCEGGGHKDSYNCCDGQNKGDKIPLCSMHVYPPFQICGCQGTCCAEINQTNSHTQDIIVPEKRQGIFHKNNVCFL